MTNNIRPADINDFEAVRYITQTTIRTVYPNYYPEGAVEFFSAHHSDERIREDRLFVCMRDHPESYKTYPPVRIHRECGDT